MEITCSLTFYHDVFYYFKNPLLPHHVSALFHLESHTKRNNEVLFQEKDMETPFMHAKKSTNFGNKKKKRTKCCAWCSTNSCLCPSIVTVKLLHQWSVAHCFSKLCLYRALSSIFSKSHHLATFNCNMVAIKLKFWSPPKVERERERENEKALMYGGRNYLQQSCLDHVYNKSCLIPFWFIAQLRNISILK